VQFLEDFNPELKVDSPGRINIIGEHTDYNLGFVLPTAIDKKIHFAFERNGSDTECNIYSKGFNKGFTVALNALTRSSEEWENYILGVLSEINKRTDGLKGFNCSIESGLPMGSGVSSSAALECGLAAGLNALFQLHLTKEDIVLLSRDAEHNFVGTKCGIMDQYASVMSKKDHVILLDCESVKPTFIPIDIAPYKILMLNSNVSHNLATSAYNTRREECEAGVRIIQKKYPEIKTLREVDTTMLNRCKSALGDLLYRRCNYIVEENKRVLAVVAALKHKQLSKVGALLYASHEGIQYDYEVSCAETDFLVNFSTAYETVLGARQMGGGFGGCALTLIHETAISSYIDAVAEAYMKEFGITLSAFEALPDEGTVITFV